MTKDDMIRMAFKYTVGGLEFDEKGLLRFVDIITAVEREACAQIADIGADGEDPYCCLPVANSIAQAIRARGQNAN